MRSAISSDRCRGLRALRGRLAAFLVAAVVAGPWESADAKVLLTVNEALALAFPDCRIERRTVFLTPEQLERAGELAGVEIGSALVHPYEARCQGESAGTAYLDTHRVRTLAETVMVAVDPEGQVRRVEVLAFREPPEYIPREIWYRQFEGRGLDPELRLKRKIRGVSGATLTARATTEAVRRVLAIHRVLHEESSP